MVVNINGNYVQLTDLRVDGVDSDAAEDERGWVLFTPPSQEAGDTVGQAR